MTRLWQLGRTQVYVSTDIDTSLKASRNSLKSIIPSLLMSRDRARSLTFSGGICRCENWFKTSQEFLNSSKLMHPKINKEHPKNVEVDEIKSFY